MKHQTTRYTLLTITRISPVQKTRLSELVNLYGCLDRPEAPLYWNNIGRREIMTISELTSKFRKHQQQIVRLWLQKDTKNALVEMRKEGAVQNGIDKNSPLEGIFLYHDKERGVYVNVVKVD